MNATIEITLHPDQPARPQVELALANFQPQCCPKHHHELLRPNLQTALNRVSSSGMVTAGGITRVFDRCSDCPHNWEDDIQVGHGACAGERLGRRIIDRDGKPLPFWSEPLEISLDESFNDALARQVTNVKGMGMRCAGRDLALRKVAPPKTMNVTLNVDCATCPACELERMGLTPDEARASFSNFVCDPPLLSQYLRACQDYAAKPKGVLLLLGSTGTGKTHLGTGVLRDRIVRGDNHLVFFKARHLFDKHWQSIRPVSFDAEQPESPLKQCQQTPLLMLDELAMLPKHFDAEGFLLNLFEVRLGAYRPTIITSNFGRADLEAAIGSRLFDRLRRASAALLEFGFASKRPQFNADYLKQDPRWN